MQKEPCYYTNLKVVLNEDLTRYHPKLKSGVHGIIISTNSRLGDRFCLVKFEDITNPYDILYGGLSPIPDDLYRQKQNEIMERKKKEYDNASEIVLKVGPKGGFRSLSYKSKNGEISCSTSNHDKYAAEKIMSYFRSIRKEIKTEQDK